LNFSKVFFISNLKSFHKVIFLLFPYSIKHILKTTIPHRRG